MDSSGIVPDSSGGGNTQSPPPPSKKPLQSPSRKNFFFTYYGYTNDEIAPLVATLKKFAYKGKIQTELGEKNKGLHLQGMIWCKEKHRDTEFKLSKKIHWETMKDVDNVRNYCNKDETFTGDFRTSWGFPAPLKLITPNKWWQQEILELLKTEPDDRKVHWYWSHAGEIGKSQFAKYCVAKIECMFFEEGSKKDIMHLIFEAPEERLERMIVDVPRDNGNNISYKAIESIKNGMIYSPKYEGGYKLFNSPHIVIFANEEPQYHRLSRDRWVVKNIDEDLTREQPATYINGI